MIENLNEFMSTNMAAAKRSAIREILKLTQRPEVISDIEIVNVMGQVVYRAEVNSDNAVCDVNGLANGVYVVRIRHFGKFSEHKFVKE